MTDGAKAKSQDAAEALAEKRPKTAVVLIHGMGEQRPMATLWGFVDAIWSSDRDMVLNYDAPVYAKPDTINESVDLRRITTRYWEGSNPRRVDFFEYYWAHMMRGNTVRGTVAWIFGLFIRRPSSVPAGLRYVWVAGLIFLMIAVALFAAAALPETWAQAFLSQQTIMFLGFLSTASGLGAAAWLAPVAGDAARYFSTHPDNVEARQTIISSGSAVIEKLTRSGEYDRIIVVGHSLGSAIGLDVLHNAFSRVMPDQWAKAHTPGSAAAATLAQLEKLSVELSSGTPLTSAVYETALSDFRTAQKDYAAVLRDQWRTGGATWIVSDFITLGSPLSKANVLLARDDRAFKLLAERRGVPTCPPKFERKTPPRFSFPARGGALIPHYGATFAPTQWTNIYFPSYAIIFGDIISGPVAPLFGQGIRDLCMSRVGLRFRHLDYWWMPDPSMTPEWIDTLRRAVNLRLRSETALWKPTDDGLPPVLPDVNGPPNMDRPMHTAIPIDTDKTG